MKNISIGIDLGTTHSVISHKNNIIENAEGRRLTESCVYFDKSGKEVLVGHHAYLQLGKEPQYTINNVKRLIGRDSENNEVLSQDNTFFGYRVVDVSGMKAIAIPSKAEKKYNIYMPEQISSMVLQKLLKDAERRLGSKVTCAVVTIPAYFNNKQRERTKLACEQAKLPLIRLLNEPTAAALAYGLDKKLQALKDKRSNTEKEQENGNRNEVEEELETTILVYDIGGSTTDVSVIQMDELGMFQVLATSGDIHLGGREFDQALARYMMNTYKLLNLSDRARQNLIIACESVKSELSTKLEATFYCESLDIQMKLTRAKFENICNKEFNWCEQPLDELFESEPESMRRVREVIMVGGTSRIPRIRDILRSKFPRAIINCNLNPDEVVAQGAGIYAEHLMKMANCNRSNDESNTTIRNGIQDETLMELPDDMEDLIDNMCLIDVCPMTIGIESDVSMMVPIIPRYTAIPCEKTQVFTTEEDSQEFVTIKVFEGERQLTRFCNKVAEFKLSGIHKAPRGIPRIEVTYALDASGVLTVSAVDKTTGVSEQIVVNESTLLESRSEYNRHQKKTTKANDMLLIDAISATNTLNRRIYDIREFAIHMADYESSQELMEKLKEANTYLEKAKAYINKDDDSIEYDIVKQIAFECILKSNELTNVTEKLLEDSGALRETNTNSE